jgi:hypothetical protein
MAEPQTELALGTTINVVLGEPATYDIAGFEALAGLLAAEVVDVVNIGAGGGSAAVQSYIPLKTGEEVKRSGAISYNDRTVQMGRHLADNAVHQALKSGFDGANKGKVHSVAIVYADLSADYFTATISGFAEEQLDANTFKMLNVTFSPTRKVVSKAGATVYTLSYAAGANGTIIGNTSQQVESGEDGTAVYASASSGFVFDEWSDSSTENPRIDDNVTGNITVTASFIAD